jgi:hypothetical protein
MTLRTLVCTNEFYGGYQAPLVCYFSMHKARFNAIKYFENATSKKYAAELFFRRGFSQNEYIECLQLFLSLYQKQRLFHCKCVDS